MPSIAIGAEPLTVERVAHVARDRPALVLASGVEGRVRATREAVEAAASGASLKYGINTGVGSLAGERLTPEQQAETQLALIRSHAAGVGGDLDPEVTRAAMFLRASSLSKGYSGVTIEVVNRFVDVLNSTYTPVVPKIGSLGCSGDLAQLAHLASVLFLAEGQASTTGGQQVHATEVHQSLKLEGTNLGPKEGLSLINGTEFMSGALSLAIVDATRLLATADAAFAFTRAALLAHPDAVGQFAQDLRPHAGQDVSARNARDWAVEESILADLRTTAGVTEPQDAYALRCTPQVHGAVASTLAYARAICSIEINSCTDNPSIDLESGDMAVVSHGNFHGAPLAFAADFLRIALADLASLSERRVNRLMDHKLSRGLPAFLTSKPGPNSGFMILHYTMAALVNLMKTRAAPYSVDSIPTSAGQEDHVSMGWNACLALRQSVSELATVLAIELMAACEALRIRGMDSELTDQTRDLVGKLSRSYPPLEEDRSLSQEVAQVAADVLDGRFAPVEFVRRYTEIEFMGAGSVAAKGTST